MNIILKNSVRVVAVLITFHLSLIASSAQPSWVKKATKSVFTLKTFAADGSLIGSSNGFFTGTNGEAVSNFTPFKGASRAVIIDAQGKELPVVSILGANDMYDVAKFRVGMSKTQPLTLASATASAGQTAWLLPYREQKSVPSGAIRKAEVIQEKYAYYTVAMQMPESAISCPLMNEAGEVIGLMQQPAAINDTLSYAVSAVFADSLKTTGLTFSDPTLQLTSIKKELPNDLNDAVLTVYLAASSLDSAAYATLVNDFIEKFPGASDGYLFRAQAEAANQHFAEADGDIQQALRLSEKKDETHFSYARMIYNKEVYQNSTVYPEWNLDKALSEIRSANGLNPQPNYRQMEANILFAQQQYQEAYNIYDELTKSTLRGAEITFAAARCKEMLKDTTAQLALMDSTMAFFSKPYLKEAAPYLWARASARRSAGKYRDAVNDMNDYEELMRAEINDNFYYVRHQTEIEGRLYQQALNDINRAIQINPTETLYYAEKASLQIRVGMTDEAIKTAQECIAIDAQNSDGYLFLGLGQCLKGQKKEGLQNLLKAKELGDPQAESLIERYSK